MNTRNVVRNLKDPEVIMSGRSVVKGAQDQEPAWVHGMPAASGLWNMILTFR